MRNYVLLYCALLSGSFGMAVGIAIGLHAHDFERARETATVPPVILRLNGTSEASVPVGEYTLTLRRLPPAKTKDAKAIPPARRSFSPGQKQVNLVIEK